jgi:hypothetical protein
MFGTVLSPYIPDDIIGEAGVVSSKSGPEISLAATIDMTSVNQDAIAPLSFTQFKASLVTTNKGVSVKGQMLVTLTLAAKKIQFDATVEVSTARTMSITWKSTNLTFNIMPGVDFVDPNVAVEINLGASRSLTVQLGGRFRLAAGADQELGLLSEVLGPFNDVDASLGLVLLPPKGFKFRLGLSGRIIGVKTSTVEVLSGSVSFEIGRHLVSVEVHTTLKLKVGTPDNYPLLTLRANVTVGGKTPSPTLDLTGNLAGQQAGGCWGDAFDVKGLSICDVTVGFTLTIRPPYIQGVQFSGKIHFSERFTIVIGIRYNSGNPEENVLVGSFHGSLKLDDVVQVAVDLAAKANGRKAVQLPTIPGFELRSISLKLAKSDMTIAEVLYEKGFAFNCDLTLFGISVQIGIYMHDTGFGASFKMTRVSFLGDLLQLCDNKECSDPKAGPRFELRFELFPPEFLLNTSSFVNILGFKMGTSMLVSWTDLTNFKAEFNMDVLDFKVGGLSVFTIGASQLPFELSSGRRLLSSLSDSAVAAAAAQSPDPPYVAMGAQNDSPSGVYKCAWVHVCVCLRACHGCTIAHLILPDKHHPVHSTTLLAL